MRVSAGDTSQPGVLLPPERVGGRSVAGAGRYLAVLGLVALFS